MVRFNDVSGARGGGPQYRSTALDRRQCSVRSVAVAGPVAGLDEDRLRAVLDEAADSAPDARIALAPSASSRRWGYRRPVLARVASRPDLDTSDLGELLTEIVNRPGEQIPLDMFICGEYLAIDYSHGLGDGFLGLVLLNSLLGGDPDYARSLAKGLSPHALSIALKRHFGSDPARVRNVLRIRRIDKAAPDEGGGTLPVGDWESALRCASACMDPVTVAELRAWASAHAAGSTTASVSIALWAAALRAEGAPVDQRVTMLVNCRRYLSAEHLDANGNFAVPISIPLSLSPTEIAERVRQVNDSGLPLARLAMVELKDRLVRRTNALAAPVYATDRMRLAFTDLGRLKMFDRVPWVAGERSPQITGYLQLDGPDSVALVVTELGGARTFTASFSTVLIEPALIEGALNRMCADPLGVLRAAGT